MKIIEGQVFNGLKKSITEVGHDNLQIKNCTININEVQPLDSVAITGIDIKGCQLVEINNVEIAAPGALSRKYAYGMRAGYSNDPTASNKLVKISNCFWRGFGPPHAGYDLNRDIISSEIGDGELWIKDSTLSGATDAIIDCKTKNLKVARCVISDAYRLIRLWQGVTATFSECTFDTPGEHVWFFNNTAKVIFHNCTFIQPIKVSYDNSIGAIQYVTTNPLTDPWFSSVLPVPTPDPTPVPGKKKYKLTVPSFQIDVEEV